MIPGSNLLRSALRVIAPQTAVYFQNTGRTTNAAGLDVSTFAAGANVRGSIQAVDLEKYEDMGLDFQHNYIQCYLLSSGIDIARDKSGDQMTFNGKRYQYVKEANWFVQDGWVGFLAVEIGNA